MVLKAATNPTTDIASIRSCTVASSRKGSQRVIAMMISSDRSKILMGREGASLPFT